jgi:hypothetical protein
MWSFCQVGGSTPPVYERDDELRLALSFLLEIDLTHFIICPMKSDFTA